MSDEKPTIQDEMTTLTRDRIMEGLAQELLESGPHEVSIQAVANRAGVSHRTVYRYFGTKDELFQAFGAWTNDRLGDDHPSNAPATLRDLEERIIEVYRSFDRDSEIAEAFVRMGMGRDDVEVRNRRTEEFGEVVRQAASDVSREYQNALAGLVRQIASSQTWARARRDFGADGEHLGDVASWMVKMVNDALESGDVPATWKKED